MVIRLNPDNATAYNNRGNAYARKGDYERAIADFDKAIRLKPDYVEALINRGTVYYWRAETEKHLRELRGG